MKFVIDAQLPYSLKLFLQSTMRFSLKINSMIPNKICVIHPMKVLYFINYFNM